MKPSRGLGAAGVCAHAVPAGTMASSSGRAMVAPAPLENGAPRQVLLEQEHAQTPRFEAPLTGVPYDYDQKGALRLSLTRSSEPAPSRPRLLSSGTRRSSQCQARST